ncbi:MAG: tetratricopeptide repeat protein, partial [Planctomycetota bacterium]
TPERTRNALVEAQLNLAGTLLAADRDLEEAEQLLVGGVEGLRHDPADVSRLMGALVRLGRLQLLFERVPEAEASHTEALGLARVIYGDAHLNLTNFLEGLAAVYSAQDRLVEALELRREVHDLHLAKLGPEHEQTKRVRLEFATALLEVGELEQAHTLCEDVYLWAVGALGAADGRIELARTTLLRVLVAREELEGPGTFADEIRQLQSGAD